MKKRFFSLLLAMCLVIAMVPSQSFGLSWTMENTIHEGWYNLRAMTNYLNITSQGDAELRKLSDNEAYYVENHGGAKYTLKMKDGRYLGLDGSRTDGARVKAVKNPYTWLIYWEATNFNKEKSDIFSLRPPEAVKMVVNASGEKNADGTPVIIWTHDKLDAPNHAEFRFIPVGEGQSSTGEMWQLYTENGLTGYKDYSGKVMIKAQFERAEKFSQGIAKVYNKDKGVCAYIDTTGKLITPYKYEPAGSGNIVTDGLMRVAIDGPEVVNAIMNGDGIAYSESIGTTTTVVMKSGKRLKYDPKYGFINTKGKEVIPLQFYEAYSFQEGRATVFQYQGATAGYKYSKVGYIDTTGKIIVPYKYGGENLYDGKAFTYKDGLVPFFEYLGKAGFLSDGTVLLPPGGIMDKQGKIIIPSNPSRLYHSYNFGLKWEDGIIVNCYYAETNKQGVQTKGGGYEWTFTELYDYSGKLIKKLDGYTDALVLGGGYVIALHQLATDPPENISGMLHIPGYWTLFDRNGNIVLDKLQKNNFNLPNTINGYANGYVYFGGESHKVSDMPAPSVTVTQPEPDTQVTPPASSGTAVPSKNSFVMNDKPVSLSAAYSINNTHYLQLTGIAVMLNGTASQFEVGWDGKYAVIEPGKPYTGVVTSTKLQNTTNVRSSGTKFNMNGEVFTFSDARLIDGDTNYLQLREFAQKLKGTKSQFNVYWDSKASVAVIQPGKPYTGEAQ
ncbi:MAG: WG repeat-containing protein [Clostridiales bacterium]|nr:WG repeat-containing protein [Clostridiales bacterium]